MKRKNHILPGQTEFHFIGSGKRVLRLAPQFRLREGDFVYLNERICPVVRVNDCAAIIEITQPAREFTTIFGKHVRLKPKPRLIRISSNAEIPILKRTRIGGAL